MGERLHIDGWEVASAELERRWAGRDREPPDRCWLFRSPTAWALVTMRRTERSDDHHDRPAAGTATITADVFSALTEVAAHVGRAYYASEWEKLLDVGHEHDDELYQAWVPERIRRDFDAASIHRKDLAEHTALIGGAPALAPSRGLPGWHDDAVADMAAHLTELGFEVLDERPEVQEDPESWNPQLGALRVRRYGYEAIAVVRIDGAGEVYVRLPEPANVAGPVFRPVASEPGAGEEGVS